MSGDPSPLTRVIFADFRAMSTLDLSVAEKGNCSIDNDVFLCILVIKELTDSAV